jgi:Right handed beta helix region
MKKHLSFTLALVVAWLLGSSVFGATINVPSASYPTIQAGIDAASDGDTVVVADGTYTGAGNKDLDFKGKAITLKSQNGPQNCIIDAEGDGRGFYFHSGEGPFSVLDGFTVRNCNKNGVYCYHSSPSINNCIITGNMPEYGSNQPDGAGILCNAAAPTITNCTISHNFAARTGGGIHAYQASPTILNCVVSFNEATTGGGVSLYESQSTLTNCTITTNTAQNFGGGIFANRSTASINNCIIWANSPEQIIISEGGTAVTYCDIQGGLTGEGNINSDPLFVDLLSDVHLTGTSPCINMGNNTAPLLPTTDKDGVPRIVNGTVDMGAYEFYTGPVYPAASGCIELRGAPAPSGVQVQLKQKKQDTQATTTNNDGCYQFESVVAGKPFDITIKGLVVTK